MAKNLVPYRDYDPFREMDRMLGQMQSLIERPFGWTPPRTGWNMPAINLSEDELDLVVEAQVPGLSEDQIDVRVEGDRLTISGEYEDKHEEQADNRIWHVIEQSYGRFERSIRLPAEVKADKADASLDNGVLTIRLPKAEVSQAKKIAVKAKKLLKG